MFSANGPDLSMMTVLPKAVDYKDAFFQDLRHTVDPLVQNSLFLYVAYEIKAQEAAKFKADPKADVPFLKKEAELRGVKVAELASVVESKGVAFKDAVRKMELLRIEFNIRYEDAKEYLDKLHLRDEFIAKIKEISVPLQ
jgi:hypothetical protein